MQQISQTRENSQLAPVFVVGTGRCGSTLVSNMLREHPRILSLSEWFSFITDFSTAIPPAFQSGLLSSGQFWHLLSRCYPRQNMLLKHGLQFDELLYRPGKDPRFPIGSEVPAILMTGLPHLTPQPEALFFELQEWVLSQPARSIRDHYLGLFAYLCERFDREIWVERSGGSLRMIRELHTLFPEAKFLHIVRDGRDCSVSSSKHSAFQMTTISYQLTEMLGCDPFEDSDRTYVEDLSDELYGFLPENFTAKAFEEYHVSPTVYGHYWSGDVAIGLDLMARLPNHQALTIRYEDILLQPEQTIRQLVGFVGPEFVEEEWITRAAALVRSPRSAWRELPLKEREQLQEACRPGFDALCKADIVYNV
jgi:hypothetical protein